MVDATGISECYCGFQWLGNEACPKCALKKKKTKMAIDVVADVLTDGEQQVPDHIWKLPHFQSWLQAHKEAGNRLDGFDVKMEFWVAGGKFLFCWVAHVNIYVADEDRNKTNEIVISRPDIKHVVCIHNPDDGPKQVVLVREFRSTASTKSGFILESPGGSSYKAESDRDTACEELFEETGIRIDPERLTAIGSRQLAGTFSAHKAHVFAVALTADEMEVAAGKAGMVFGNADDAGGEQTYVEVHRLQDLLTAEVTDWSTLGMIFAAFEALA